MPAKVFFDFRLLVLYGVVAAALYGIQYGWVYLVQDYAPATSATCELKVASIGIDVVCGKESEPASSELIAYALKQGSPLVSCQILRGTYLNTPDIKCGVGTETAAE